MKKIQVEPNNNSVVKLVIYVPETHADIIRKVIGELGAGNFPHYKFCSFSVKGIGRFLPVKGANPAMGETGKLAEVIEERIETVCYRKNLDKIINAVKKVHPYEEIAIDVFPLVLNPYITTSRNQLN